MEFAWYTAMAHSVPRRSSSIEVEITRRDLPFRQFSPFPSPFCPVSPSSVSCGVLQWLAFDRKILRHRK
jgi:hypothetical protein